MYVGYTVLNKLPSKCHRFRSNRGGLVDKHETKLQLQTIVNKQKLHFRTTDNEHRDTFLFLVCSFHDEHKWQFTYVHTMITYLDNQHKMYLLFTNIDNQQRDLNVYMWLSDYNLPVLNSSQRQQYFSPVQHPLSPTNLKPVPVCVWEHVFPHWRFIHSHVVHGKGRGR